MNTQNYRLCIDIKHHQEMNIYNELSSALSGKVKSSFSHTHTPRGRKGVARDAFRSDLILGGLQQGNIRVMRTSRTAAERVTQQDGLIRDVFLTLRS